MADMNRERCFTRKRIRLEDVSYSDPNMVYFATLCARDKRRVFENAAFARQVVDSLMWCRENGRLRVYAYCLMPEHLHFSGSPVGGGLSLMDSIGRFKSFTETAARGLGISGQIWQRGWYDRIARRDEDVLSVCEYILGNPVRKGLVELAEDWPYSGMPDPLPW